MVHMCTVCFCSSFCFLMSEHFCSIKDYYFYTSALLQCFFQYKTWYMVKLFCSCDYSSSMFLDQLPAIQFAKVSNPLLFSIINRPPKTIFGQSQSQLRYPALFQTTMYPPVLKHTINFKRILWYVWVLFKRHTGSLL